MQGSLGMARDTTCLRRLELPGNVDNSSPRYGRFAHSNLLVLNGTRVSQGGVSSPGVVNPFHVLEDPRANALPTRAPRNGDLVDKIARALEKTGLEPRNPSLEVVERVLMESAEVAVERLQALKDLEVHIIIDGFGAAYSALSSFKRFPLSQMQIGRSLTAGSMKSKRTRPSWRP